ncbi:hypothetical protein GC093_16925 [Paenibacillus sp. LMG 31456]|uniref:Uncharacterized protein n=1 Tax=Paenibacillus foliorum TaxID=2654974 RepID=A0A972GW34_9BACL|nr:hypothetical protein [Paenibacillus foliorum]NOU94892.1 hypothetical protein [Paenibacillus foliorum]
MQEIKFRKWLEDKGYDTGTVKSRIYNCQRICEFEGNIDHHYEIDKCKTLLPKLEYSTDDERNGLPARHNIPINGVIRTGTATFKQALKLYISFLVEGNSKAIGLTPLTNTFDQSDTSKVKEATAIDSYALFLHHFNIDNTDFYNFGIKNTIFANITIANTQWESLKNKLVSNQQLAIRGYGRQGINTALYLELYEYLFNNNKIIQDPTNNNAPRRNIQSATGYAINKNIFNYQCSHVFGKTKNPLLFEAVWNICLIPKMYDPLTGHETTGDWPREFQGLFHKYVFEYFKAFIDDFNNFILSHNIESRINHFVTKFLTKYDSKLLMNFKEDALSEWAMIK